MKSDPMDQVTRTTVTQPPFNGPGSGKEAWREFGLVMGQTTRTLWEKIDEQSAVIRELNAEILLLKKQIATRKPKGGRPPIDDEKASRIEADLAAGHSQRSIAARHRVSPMTVGRIAKRVAERLAVSRET